MVKVSIVPARSPKVMPAVDDETLDLVEDRQVAGVGRVAAVAAAGHDRVDRQRRCASIRRICTGEVWVRSSTVSRLAEVEVEACPTCRGRGGPAAC